MNTVKSADGTSIAFETTGKGPPLILVGGAFCDRTAPASGTPLAALLAQRFTVFSYDRRGRGDSEDTPPHALEREVEDLAALITAAGGSAAVFGNSSGGLLALDAAARGLSIPKLVVYEPPVILDEGRARAFEDLAKQLDDAAAGNRRSEAVELYFTKVMQMPASAVAQMRKAPMWAGLEHLAHTLSYDLLITARGPLRLEQVSAVRAATLVMEGGASPGWMREAIQTLARAIPNARHRTLEGQTHAVDPKALAQALEAFLGG
ncbi:alpha/beta hydrolase [Corallococcus carmarthensis]|uniref:Alpha/beta hydrolase n=1 Tax=Corallococcus carmarthensis TaxID=2316728 RepID=A0A3A8KZW8_9BACT|nr:alpha/beta hydrolase [Corallococcus carmarthensis]RKH07544.1 alpha/beta hydrolase [Corallococcus carmarthensis]